MITRKKTAMGHFVRECIVLVVVLASLCLQENHAIPQFGLVSPLASVNCSVYCHCQLVDIHHGIQEHYHKHNTFSAMKYGEDAKSSSKHIEFLGFFSIIVGNMISISCNVNDGRTHTVSSLLNGIEYLKYSALSVTCRSGEEIVWDIPSSQVSFNIFESKKCKIIREEDSKTLTIPMNMWIFDVEDVRNNLINEIDIKYTTNTLSFSIEGTDTFNIPDNWIGDAMISVDRFSLQSNNLKRFDCKIQFTKDMDLINLNNNDLARFPECILSETRVNIRFLSLSNNDISDISSLYESQTIETSIETIDLSFNLIQRIGTFMPIRKLIILDLSNNQISQINDDAFNELSGLKQLHLQNNKINYIGPVAFRGNINLSLLKLNNNLLRLVQMEQFSSSATTRLQIDLRKNRLRTPPFMNEIRRHEYPQNIYTYSANNNFHCDCNLIEFQNFLGLNKTCGNGSFLDFDEFKCATPRINKGKAMKNTNFTEWCPVVDRCPLNCECTLYETRNFVVNCTARRLLEMPEAIPLYPKARVILDLSHNPLQLLGHRSYLPNLSELYMDNCLITSVSPQAISSLQSVEVLRLHKNLLQKLPANTKNITLKQASNVTLHDNRWSCSCDSLWLPSWISMHRRAVWMPGSVVCNYLKKPIEDFSPGDVNCESISHKEVFLALSMIGSSVVSTFMLFFYYSKEIKLFLYTKLGIRICTDFTYGDMFSPYDAFVSYGQDNYRWVVDTLVPTLEDGPKKYKLCLHYRDFPTTESNIENIPWAIRLSRCSILVLSKDFMRKEWCILELRAIFQRLLMSANKLIIISTDDVDPDELTPDLRDYIKTHDFLRIDEPKFWDRLEMVLPPKETMADLLPLIQECHSETAVDKETSNEDYIENQIDCGFGDTGSGKEEEDHFEKGDCGMLRGRY